MAPLDYTYRDGFYNTGKKWRRYLVIWDALGKYSSVFDSIFSLAQILRKTYHSWRYICSHSMSHTYQYLVGDKERYMGSCAYMYHRRSRVFPYMEKVLPEATRGKHKYVLSFKCKKSSLTF